MENLNKALQKQFPRLDLKTMLPNDDSVGWSVRITKIVVGLLLLAAALGIVMHHYHAAELDWQHAADEVARDNMNPSKDPVVMRRIGEHRITVNMGALPLACYLIYSNFLAHVAAVWAAGWIVVTIVGVVATVAIVFFSVLFCWTGRPAPFSYPQNNHSDFLNGFNMGAAQCAVPIRSKDD